LPVWRPLSTARIADRYSWVIFNFHGYPSAVRHLLWDRPRHERFTINGYREEGTTTTPFCQLAMNGVDRYTVAIQAVRAVPELAATDAGRATIARYELARRESLAWADAHGDDHPAITGW
jgi:xylulose-5-phosphate/fructose-6-phosphate phosphoketolase